MLCASLDVASEALVQMSAKYLFYPQHTQALLAKKGFKCCIGWNQYKLNGAFRTQFGKNNLINHYQFYFSLGFFLPFDCPDHTGGDLGTVS